MTARVEDVLAQQAARLGDRPLLTYYDDGTGERTELGYATFANWAAKTANLLADRDVDPGDDVLVAVDGHWAALVVVAACGLAGARAVVFAGAPEERAAALAVIHERHAGVELPAARLLVGEGLGGRLSGAEGEPFVAEALACDDDYADPEVSGDDEWLVLPGEAPLTQSEALEAGSESAGERLLLQVPIERALPQTVAAITAGGSVVAVRGGDEALLDRLQTTERCGARVP